VPFDEFLHDTFGDDQDLAGYVQRLVGISAIGSVLEQLLPFAIGPGANGKSTLQEAAMHALGRGDDGYARAGSSEMLMVRKHAEHPAELAQLSGARLVVRGTGRGAAVRRGQGETVNRPRFAVGTIHAQGLVHLRAEPHAVAAG
jgi:hypothetical protein